MIYYFHATFQANIPVTPVAGKLSDQLRKSMLVRLPSGDKRRIPLGLLSDEPVAGFPIREDI